MSDEWDSAVPAKIGNTSPQPSPAEVRPPNGGEGDGMAPVGWKDARRKKATLRSGLDGVSPHQDRLPPHSMEAEQGVLGCILLEPRTVLSLVIEKLKAGCLAFYDLRHQQIYAALLAMHDAEKQIDLITLSQWLKDRQELEPVGGLAYLASLPDAVPSAANLDYYIEIVQEKHLLRRMVQTFSAALLKLQETEANADKVLTEVGSLVSALTEEEAKVGEERIDAVAKRVIAGIEDRHYSRGSTQLRGLPTGPNGNYVDKLIRGIRETFYMVLAGRPGSGKTSWAMNIVEYLAKEYEHWEETGETRPPNEGEEGPQKVYRVSQGIPVCVFSMEMDAECLVERMLFGRAGVDSSLFTQGFATAQDFAKLTKAAEELKAMNIYIDPSPAQTIGQLAAKARRMQQQYGIKLFVLDYMQLVEIEDGRGFERQKELTKISRKIMALKKQLRVPWLVLAQMNRNIESNEARNRQPVLSDLKDCGALEQDADVVAFVHKCSRDDVERGEPSDLELIEQATPGVPESRRPYRVDIIIPKNRFGPTGKAEMVFLKNLQKFEDWHMFKVRHGLASGMKGERKYEGGEKL